MERHFNHADYFKGGVDPRLWRVVKYKNILSGVNKCKSQITKHQIKLTIYVGTYLIEKYRIIDFNVAWQLKELLKAINHLLIMIFINFSKSHLQSK